MKRSKSEVKEVKEEKKLKTEEKKIKTEPTTKAEPKAKARSRSKSVEAGTATLNQKTGTLYWKAQSANEIRNQLRLRGVSGVGGTPLDKITKAVLVEMIVKAIKAGKN